jgi:hypothetical protein
MPFSAANRKDGQAIRSDGDPFGGVLRLKAFFYGLIVAGPFAWPAHAIVRYIAS